MYIIQASLIPRISQTVITSDWLIMAKIRRNIVCLSVDSFFLSSLSSQVFCVSEGTSMYRIHGLTRA
jgi:hypothetical protein